MGKTFKSFLKDNWSHIFVLSLYSILALSVSYGSRFYGFERIVIVLLTVILMEIRLKKLR